MQTPTKKTAHSIYNLNYHIVFVVRYRHQVLVDGVDDFLKEQIPEICERYGWEQLAIEVMPDHVYLFLSAPPMVAPNTIARTIKSITARDIFKNYPLLKKAKFWGGSFWSDGCYYGSAGTVSAATIARYIENQKTA